MAVTMAVMSVAAVRLAASVTVVVASVRRSRVVSVMAMIVMMVAVMRSGHIDGRGNIDRRWCIAEGAAAKTRYIYVVVPAVIHEIHHPVARPI
jgi:hypothetical protein